MNSKKKINRNIKKKKKQVLNRKIVYVSMKNLNKIQSFKKK